jgi:hypothetical protein
MLATSAQAAAAFGRWATMVRRISTQSLFNANVRLSREQRTGPKNGISADPMPW